MPYRLAGLSAAVLLLSAAPAAAQAPDPVALVDARAADTARVARQIWEWAELGYQEDKSSALLASELQKAGFKVTKGVAGIPTAFTAEWGSGGPVIGVLGEFDALPGISQDSVPVRDPIEGKHAAHACGHNLFGAGSVTAAIAIKKWLEATKTPGRIRFYGTPAEEGGSGKVYMVREGLFNDVDFALHWHPGSENSAAAQTSLANRSAKFRFTGKAAHAAGAPAQGRSALDEVEAMWARLEAAARGAAMGTGTEVSWEVIHGNNPLLVNETLARMMDGKLRTLGGLSLTPAETAFATEIAKTLAQPKPVALAGEIQPYGKSLGYGSTDVGDVSWATPTVGLNTATWAPGTPAHSWQSAAASGTSLGFKGAQLAAKAMTLAAIELFTDPALRTAARAEFDASRGPGYVYRSLLGDRKPPLDYRN